MAGKVVKANWFLDRAKNWKGKHLALAAVGVILALGHYDDTYCWA